jgi:Recombination endonuclease VII
MTTTKRRRTKAEMEKIRRRKETTRARNLRVRHHMTVEQYDGILDHQYGTCAICLRAKGKTRALQVDHNHALAREWCSHDPAESCEQCWRGLLCARCNQMLAHARDDRTIFRRAIEYLNLPPAQTWMVGRD